MMKINMWDSYWTTNPGCICIGVPNTPATGWRGDKSPDEGVVIPYVSWTHYPSQTRLGMIELKFEPSQTSTINSTEDVNNFIEPIASEIAQRRLLFFSKITQAAKKIESKDAVTAFNLRELTRILRLAPSVSFAPNAGAIAGLAFASVSQDCDGLVSYPHEPEYALNNTRRRKTSFAKFLRKINDWRPNSFTDDAIVQMATAYGQVSTAKESERFTFREVSGDALHAVYGDADVAESSCMNWGKEGNGDTEEYTLWYAENPKVVSMLVIQKDGQDFGRALIWDTPAGKYLDRIYPNDGLHVDLVIQYATLRGWAHRASQSINAKR